MEPSKGSPEEKNHPSSFIPHPSQRSGLVVGLTGGIASGKSAVARMFQELGAHVIDADQLAREVVAPGTPGWREVVKAFGQEYLLPDASLDRKKLARRVFSHPQEKAKLEAIIHPRILELRQKRTQEILEKDPQAVIIFDVPLLIEKGLQDRVDRVVVVWVPRKLQIKRLMERDGLSRLEAEERLRNQLPLDEKLKYAHHVIDNSGTLQETRSQVEALYRELRALAQG